MAENNSLGLALLALTILPYVAAFAGDEPQQIHIAFTEDPTAMSITWVTWNRTKAQPTVQYGLSAGALSSVASGVTKTYTEGGWNGYITTAILTDLKTSARYFYQVHSDGVPSPVSEFKTAPSATDFPDVQFVTYADVGTDTYPGAPLNDHYIAQVLNTTLEPDFVLLQGDIAYDKGDDSTWDAFFQQVQPFASSIPLMTAPGNEDHAMNFSSYRNRVVMPTQAKASLAPWWYSFDYSFVHVISMCTEASHDGGTGYWNGTAQYAWLEADLKAADGQRTQRPWIVVMGHRPLYCSSNDYYDCNMWGPKAREELEPLFSKYGVDLFLSGHVHSYERTYPVVNGTKTSDSYVNAPNTVHVMVGSGGAGLTSRWSDQPDWSAKRIIDYGVGSVQANKTHLKFDFVQTGENGTISHGPPMITDHFVLEKQ